MGVLEFYMELILIRHMLAVMPGLLQTWMLPAEALGVDIPIASAEVGIRGSLSVIDFDMLIWLEVQEYGQAMIS